MPTFSSATRPVFAAVAVAGVLAGSAVPTAAARKAPTITLSAAAVQDPNSKLCMPKTVLGPTADKSLPATICQTRADWEAQGLTIVVK